ncbi:MAG: S9 family peptidase [Chitinophagaceae bacterium]|jgi:dipeptidyl aminopeptidase/acylaminoacyl peptidase
MKKYQILLFAFLFPFFVIAQKNWSPEQVLKIKNISSAQVSPDGTKVVYTIREALMTDERSEYINHIWISTIDGSNAKQLTTGDKNNANPKWSPDNKSIAFTSSRDGKNNLYILPITGGEAEKITEAKGGISEFEWSNDGKKIAVITADAPTDKEEKNKKAKNDWYMWEEELKQNRLQVYWIHHKDSTQKYIHKLLTKENISVYSFDWNTDGTSIVYSYGKSTKANDNNYSDIALINIETGLNKIIANTPASESAPQFSPDGSLISYYCTENPNDWPGAKHAKIYAIADGKTWRLKATPNEDGSIIGWTADGKNIVWSETNKTMTSIYTLSVDGKNITEFSKGEKKYIGATKINATHTYLTFTLQNTSEFPELYVSKLNEYAPLKITSLNSSLSSLPMGKTELIKWKGADGLEIEGLLTYPINYTAGKKVPLLLNIHGGPAGNFGQTCIASNQGTYPLAALSENGYAILRPNPRGSTGYGSNFRMANRQDWGGKDYIDLMSGVDQVIKMGVTDESMLGVMGWSYGGFMSSWMVGHTNRFKAASIGAPVVDLSFQNLTDDIEGFLPSYFKSDPWNNWSMYSEHSPLRYVQNVQTPVLLQHGEADQRVPLGNSIMFYNALKRRNIPVKLLVLPRQPHGPNEPRMVLKTMQTNIDWFGTLIKP